MRLLVALVALSTLAEAATAEALQEPPPPPRLAAKRADSQRQLTSCELLFSVCDNLAGYCQCRDLIYAPPSDADDAGAAANADQPASDNLPTGANTSSRNPINQLNCAAPSLGQVYQDLSRVATFAGAQLQIDHLNIVSNISAPRERTTASNASLVDNGANSARVQVDHLSFQLTLVGGDASDSGDVGAPLAAQMIDLVERPLNATRLGSLAIYIVDAREPRLPGDKLPAARFDFGALWPALINLHRLELSVDVPRASVTLASPAGGLPARLQWLNLASNRRLEGLVGGNSDAAADAHREPGAPLKPLESLEYLSLESSRLARFPLFSALADYMANLTSLNLANNRLKSASADLFAFASSSAVRLEGNCAVRTTRHRRPRRFQMPSLFQLDLSRNWLEEFGSRAGQLLMCLAPNLNQLYLQHNQLKRLSLSALLGYPIQLSALFDDQNDESSASSSSSSSSEAPTPAPTSRNQLQLVSQLEHIDLSYNLLELLVGWRGRAAPTRLRSINLAHNRLRRPTLDQFEAGLANRLIFSETLDAPPDKHQVIDFAELQRNFQLINSSEPALTLCELAAPVASAAGAAGEQEAVGELAGELLLSQNQLERISARDFQSKQCAGIQILRLDGNNLVDLDERSLVPLTGLQELDLSSNRLVALAEQLFSENARLRSVDVSGNKLVALRENQFAALVELEELRLAENSLVELKANQFQHSARLRSIDLARNRLAHLEAGCFAHLKSLRHLDLSGNRLREIHLDRLFKPTIQPARAAPAAEQATHRSPTSKQRPAKSKSRKPPTGKSSLPKSLPAAASGKLNLNKEKRRADKTRRQASGPAELDEPGDNLLALSSNQLESLDIDDCDNAGASFARGVRSLRLDDNRLTKLSGRALNCFKALQVLDAGSNLIESLEGLAPGVWSRLVRLDLANNRLGGELNLTALFPAARQQGGTETSAELRLESLSLSGNPNLTLLAGQLARLVEAAPLRQLHLARISSIVVGGSPADSAVEPAGDEGAGRVMDELSVGSIGLVDGQFLERLLDANRTLVESVDRLDLESVRPRNGSTTLFWSRAKLLLAGKRVAILNVANNQLDTGQLLDLLSASAPAELIQLNASSNLVDKWPLAGATSATQLKLVDLSHNRLRHFLSGEPAAANQQQQQRLAALEYLDLSSNAMISLTDSPTSSRFRLRQLAPNLVHLDLSDNRLGWLPAEFFHGLSRLSTLRLGRNQLETFNLQLSSPSKVFVDLSSNRNLRSLGCAPPASMDAGKGDDDEDRDRDGQVASVCALTIHQADSRVKSLDLDEYIRQERVSHRERHEGRAGRLDISGPEVYNQEETREPLGDMPAANRCQNLLNFVRSVDLASSLINRNKLTIENLSASRPALYHLSLRQNRLGDEFKFEVSPASSALNVISFDLSENQLSQRLPNAGQFCNLFAGIRSLFLERNQFKQVPLGLGEQCQQVALIDLSNNMLAHLSDRSVEILTTLPSLKVLKLNGNRLGSWRPVDQLLGSVGLSLLDVRENGLASQQTPLNNWPVAWSPPQTVVLSEANAGQPSREPAHRYQLSLSNDSLTISWNGHGPDNKSTAPRKLSLTSLARADEHQTLESNESKFLVRFCSLNWRAPTRLCLSESARVGPSEACLLLKPPGGPKCLTNLDDQQLRPSLEEAPSTAPHILFPLNQVSRPKPGNETSPTQQDLILNMIEQLKVGWLRLKKLDLNEYLASLGNIKHDSVWLTIDGKYPVYTLTVLKFAIVVASACIIILLVAMFALLTYLYQSNGRESFATLGASASSASSASSSSSSSCGRGHDDSTGSPRSDSEEMTDLTVTMSQSGSSARSANNKTTTRGRASGCSADGGASAAGDESHFRFGASYNQNSTGQNPAAKRAPPRETRPFNQLDAGLLLGQQQLCSTPSSSLAPSSVETAETMQAVDSIRSGPSGQVAFNQGAPANYQLSSVDQYNEASYAPIDCGPQPPAPLVATVMRMVKSSSANDFEANQAALASLHDRQRLYGTLSRHNERANYSTLKSKIRANQQRYGRVYPATLLDSTGLDRFSQESGVPANNYQTRVQQQQSIGTLVESSSLSSRFEHQAHESRHTNDLDPTTLSLLSINTALSSGNQNNSAATSQQVSPATFVIDQQQQQQQQQQSARGLCQFHHNLVRPSQEPMIERANPEIILEREEEHYPFDDSLFFEVHDIMPPPPPPS